MPHNHNTMQKLPNNLTAEQFRQHIAARFAKPAAEQKGKAKKQKTLPYQTEAVQKMRQHIGEFCRKWPRAGTVLNTKNPYYRKGWKYFHAEELMQIVFCNWLKEYCPEVQACHFKNEGKAGHVEQARKALMGVRSGAVDLLLQKEGCRDCWLELKVKGNKPTPNQVAFLEFQARLGSFTGVPYTLFEAAGMVVEWLEGGEAGNEKI